VRFRVVSRQSRANDEPLRRVPLGESRAFVEVILRIDPLEPFRSSSILGDLAPNYFRMADQPTGGDSPSEGESVDKNRLSMTVPVAVMYENGITHSAE